MAIFAVHAVFWGQDPAKWCCHAAHITNWVRYADVFRDSLPAVHSLAAVLQ